MHGCRQKKFLLVLNIKWLKIKKHQLAWKNILQYGIFLFVCLIFLILKTLNFGKYCQYDGVISLYKKECLFVCISIHTRLRSCGSWSWNLMRVFIKINIHNLKLCQIFALTQHGNDGVKRGHGTCTCIPERHILVIDDDFFHSLLWHCDLYIIMK